MFESYGSGNTNEGNKKEIDYNALDEYVVETAGLQNPDVLVGVVSGIVDLGIQAQEDSQVPFKGSTEDEEKEIENYPNTYFINGKDPATQKPCRLKCWPQKAIQSVAIAVDFPAIMLDKGQFFSDKDSESKPLRMWLGGQFYNSSIKAMTMQRSTPLRIGKDAKGRWSFNNKHLFYKMAVASKLTPPDGVFLPQDIDKLVGKAFQFEAQIFMKENGTKSYYTEKVSFKSGLGRGQEAPESPVETFVVQFNGENNPQALKEIRNHVANTIRMANNYEGSPIQRQLEAAKNAYKSVTTSNDLGDEPEVKAPEVKKPVAAKKVTKVVPPEGDDDGSPF